MCVSIRREVAPLNFKSPCMLKQNVLQGLYVMKTESHVCSCMGGSGQLEMSSSYVCWHSIVVLMVAFFFLDVKFISNYLS